jgi:DnaD/phage-associated family protein
MADFRQTYCKMWSDSWFSELVPDEKLLWSYFFTNEHTSVAGIYEISTRTMAFETGIERGRVNEIIKKFVEAKKCRYENGILWVFNMLKYQKSGGDKVLIRIRKDVMNLPDSQIKRDYMSEYRIDTLSIHHPELSSDTDTDTDTDKETETETETETEKAVVPAKSSKINIFSLYEQNIGMINPMMAEKLKLAEDEFPPGWISRAIEIAVENNKRSWNYVHAILDRWRSSGYDGGRKNGKSHQAEQAQSVVDKIVKEVSHASSDIRRH